jgi:hypothetical protein
MDGNVGAGRVDGGLNRRILRSRHVKIGGGGESGSPNPRNRMAKLAFGRVSIEVFTHRFHWEGHCDLCI